MKYRIKDPKKREAIKTLFNREEFELIQRFPCSAKVWFFIVDEEINATAFDDDTDVELEPVKELEDGWHLYPQEKPEKANELYIVAYKNGNAGQGYINTCRFNGKIFDLLDSDIIAWRDCPKLWKGD